MCLGACLDGHEKSRPPRPTGILSLDRPAKSVRRLRYLRCISLISTSQLKLQLISNPILKQINEFPIILKTLTNIKRKFLRREGDVRIWSIRSAEGSDVI